ncbi:MAG: hypothetical protein IJA30_01625 [Bacilli bacterium]|nr:hypothetical protein [Bacilli bacterium]
MSDNMDLFEDEIAEIREFSELDLDVFHDVLECTRGVVEGLGNKISPISVVDIIEGAVENLVYETAAKEEGITVDDAVNRAVENLGLIDDTAEIEAMLEDNKYTPSDELDTGKVRQ